MQKRATIYSGLVLASALGVLWLGHFFSQLQGQEVMLRNIDIAVMPPPPPPPPSQNVVEETELTMQVKGSGAQVTMANLEVTPNIEVIKPDMPQVQVQQSQWQMPEVEWSAFKLSELDSKPTLLTPVKIRFPKQLKRRGIERVVVKLDVVIDEQGNVNLVDIIDNPYNELNQEIMRFVKGSKFTSPFKADEAVKARFIWPVVIEA